MTVCQKMPKSYFQSQFCMSKINKKFSKQNSFKNINSHEKLKEEEANNAAQQAANTKCNARFLKK